MLIEKKESYTVEEKMVYHNLKLNIWHFFGHINKTKIISNQDFVRI